MNVKNTEQEKNIILKCENLHKKMGKKEILKGVNVVVEAGDILGFIGPNGAGKTTTIKLILGLQSITLGKVFINGFDLQKDFTKAIEKVGAIVENPDLYMYLSGYENLKLVANLYKGISSARINEVVKMVGLENRIKDKVSKYSLGMRQRLGIAQAILHSPNLLILDEPTNGLDPEGIKDLRDLLKKLAKEENMAIFISSHNLAELESFCNKVCIIQNGVVIENSNIQKIKKMATNNWYHIEVDDTNKIEKQNKNITILNDKEFEIYIEKDEVPKLVQQLVAKKILIYCVQEKEITLEEAFLKKTGGNSID